MTHFHSSMIQRMSTCDFQCIQIHIDNYVVYIVAIQPIIGNGKPQGSVSLYTDNLQIHALVSGVFWSSLECTWFITHIYIILNIKIYFIFHISYFIYNNIYIYQNPLSPHQLRVLSKGRQLASLFLLVVVGLDYEIPTQDHPFTCWWGIPRLGMHASQP